MNKARKLLCCLMLLTVFGAQTVMATSLGDVLVFDVAQGKVVKKQDSTEELQQELMKCLQTIDGVVMKLNIEPQDGTVLKFTAGSSIDIDNKWYEGQASEVFIFIPAKDDPYLMIFTSDNKPLLFHFKHDVSNLVKQLNLAT